MTNSISVAPWSARTRRVRAAGAHHCRQKNLRSMDTPWWTCRFLESRFEKGIKNQNRLIHRILADVLVPALVRLRLADCPGRTVLVCTPKGGAVAWMWIILECFLFKSRTEPTGSFAWKVKNETNRRPLQSIQELPVKHHIDGIHEK